MLRCEYHALLGPYHDAELPDARRRDVEAHVAACPSCERELRAMEAMSRQFRDAELPQMPSADKARLRQAVSLAAMRAGAGADVRPVPGRARAWAKWLTAAAAAVFLFSLSQIFVAHWHTGTPPSPLPVNDPTSRSTPDRSGEGRDGRPTHDAVMTDKPGQSDAGPVRP